MYDQIQGKGCIKGIVGLLALPLHKNESSPKGLDFRRKGAHGRSVIALVSGVPVFQRPVGLYPRRTVSAGPRQSTDAAISEGMEKGVVGGTDGAAQLGLAGTAPASTHRPRPQLPGDSYRWRGFTEFAPCRCFSTRILR